MALTLTISSNGSSSSTNTNTTGNGIQIPRHNQSLIGLPHRRRVLFPASPRTLHLTAAKKFSSRTSKNRRNNLTTTKEQDDETKQTAGIEGENGGFVGIGLDKFVVEIGSSSTEISADGKPFPDLPGLEPGLWEGPSWDGFGFFVQYLWAFGIIFGVVACGVAVSTYNEGATDFKETPAYKESIQSQELLEQPDASNSDVFESNPTEVAPSLE